MTPKTRVKKLEDKLKPAENTKIIVVWNDGEPIDGEELPPGWKDDGIVLTWDDVMRGENDTKDTTSQIRTDGAETAR